MIDLWPETMPINSVKNIFPFTLWKNLRDKNIKYADYAVTECFLYQKRLKNILNGIKKETLYLARPLIPYKPSLHLPNDKINLCYLGSINNIIDINTISQIILEILKFKPVELHIVGDGERKDDLIKVAEKSGAFVVFHGKVYNRAEKQKIFDSCHFGLNIMKDTVCVGLTMKSIDYFELGLPIINNIKGDTWDIIDSEKCGVNFCGNIEIESIIENNVSQRKKCRNFFERSLTINVFKKKVINIMREMSQGENEKIKVQNSIIKNELISIIVPVYNVERYLSRCLESILNQTYQNIEVILVDDGSTDNSGIICDDWAKKDKRIIVVHQKNKGQSCARNVALEICHGNLIGFVDSDDWIPNDYYEYLYDLISVNNADVASCSFQYVLSKDQVKRTKDVIYIYCADDIKAEYLNSAINNSNNDCSCCTKLYKKDVIGDIRFEENMVYEDIIFNWKVLKHTQKYVRSYKKNYYYYINVKSTTRRDFSNEHLDLLTVAEMMIDRKNESEKITKIAEQYLTKCHLSILIKLMKSDEKHEEIFYKEYEELKKNRKILFKSNLSLVRKIIVLIMTMIPVRLLLKIKC